MNQPDWSQHEVVVGKRWDYYRPRFKRFARGEWLSWNWAAFFGTFAWLCYRKLHAWSWLYFLVSTPFLLAILVFITASTDRCEQALQPGNITGFIFLFLLGAGWIIPPLFANRLYYNRVKTMVAQEVTVTRTGGCVGALALQAFILCSALFLAPSYGAYIYRAMVSQGYSHAVGMKAQIQEYLVDHDRLPEKIEDVFDTTTGKYVERLVLETNGTIHAIFGNEAKKLTGHSISLIPVKENGVIVNWVCRSSDLPDQCLPSSCRGSK